MARPGIAASCRAWASLPSGSDQKERHAPRSIVLCAIWVRGMSIAIAIAIAIVGRPASYVRVRERPRAPVHGHAGRRAAQPSHAWRILPGEMERGVAGAGGACCASPRVCARARAALPGHAGESAPSVARALGMREPAGRHGRSRGGPCLAPCLGVHGSAAVCACLAAACIGRHFRQGPMRASTSLGRSMCTRPPTAHGAERLSPCR